MSSVLNVAREVSPSSTTDESGDSSDTNGQESDTAHIDLAQRLSTTVDEFLTGLLPGNARVKTDWGALSPIFSTLGSIGSLLFIAVRWF